MEGVTMFCPKCGHQQNEGTIFCLKCGFEIGTNFIQNISSDQPSISPTNNQLNNPSVFTSNPIFQPSSLSSQDAHKIVGQNHPHTKKEGSMALNISASINLLLIILIIVQLIFSPLSLPNSSDDDDSESVQTYSDEDYYELQNEKAQLQADYNSLIQNYNTLMNDYLQIENESNKFQSEYQGLNEIHNGTKLNLSNLQFQYSLLEEDYQNDLEAYQFHNAINTGHFMESCYGDIRDTYEEEWGGLWWNLVGDDEDVIEFAANLAEHDLGRLFWTDANDRYSSETGENMNEVAHSKLSLVPDYIGLEGYDSPAIKIEKILDFINDWVHYEHDLNDEFLSPIETLTFQSGDCDDYSILASAIFEEVGIESGIVFLTNDNGDGHAMCLVHLEDLGSYGHYFYDDLTNEGMQEGKWILIEPQALIDNQDNEAWMEQWNGNYFIEIDVHL